MKAKFFSISLTFILLYLVPFPTHAGEEYPFPKASPESQGLDAAALEELTRIVRSFFEEGDIAGAELLVVKNRKTVLHETIGWKDAEEKVPMEHGTIVNIRSMTKPMTGTLAQMLIDEGKLALANPASKHLESFGKGDARAIRVEHLITHRSGLPLTCINQPLAKYAGLEALAAEAAAIGPEFTPGARFQYSDAGSDSLGAVMEKASGTSLAQLFQCRIFDALGMIDAYTRIEKDDPRLQRTSSNHLGTKGAWNRYWKPGDDPIYPFAMGSQSVYCTPTDYARFLALWMDSGMAGGKQLLSKEALARGLEPVSTMGYPAGYTGLEVQYGRMWMLYINPNAPAEVRLEAFGHGGSDGTYAVAFPNRDLMVFYFTQSRGQQTITTFELALDALVINPDPEKAAALTEKIAPEKLHPYLGLFRAEGNDLYRAIIMQDGELAFENPGHHILPLKPTEEEDCWKTPLAADLKFIFERSEGGEIIGLRVSDDEGTAHLKRLKPAKNLPTVKGLMKLFLTAHGTDKLDDLGAFRFSGTINMEKRRMKGEITDLYKGRHRRSMNTSLGNLGEQRLVLRDGKAFSASPMQPPKELAGVQAEQARLGSLGALLSDWRKDYREVKVLYRLDVFGEETFVIRTVPHIGPASTKYVGVGTGMLIAEDRLVQLPGIGLMGTLVLFEDYRDVEGVKIPFRWKSKAVHPLIGTILTQFEEVETHLEVNEDAFEIESSKKE